MRAATTIEMPYQVAEVAPLYLTERRPQTIPARFHGPRTRRAELAAMWAEEIERRRLERWAHLHTNRNNAPLI